MEKPSEDLVEFSYFEVLKIVAKLTGLGFVYLIIALTGNEVLDISKVQGILFIFMLLILMTILFFFWKKNRQEFVTFKNQHEREMLCLAQSSVHAVDMVTNDMRKEMSNMKEELIDTFKATIDAYQGQVNNLVYEVLSEKRRIQTFYKPKTNHRKKK